MIGIHGAGQYGEECVQRLAVLCQAASVVFDSHGRQAPEDALEEKLRQAATMEALGVLTGGIAHDFNNMLVPILCNAELASSMLPDESEMQPILESIIGASREAGDLCNQMLAYAGRGVAAAEVVECNRMIQSSASLLHVAHAKKIDLTYHLADQPLHIMANKAQLQQVLLNLITNASEAIGGRSGTITVTTRLRELSVDECGQFQPASQLEAGTYVEIQVEDNGGGMPPETQARIFDPFFSTKFAGRGLGLAAVLGIVRNHKAGISLESTVGRGAVFRIVFPLSSRSAEAVAAPDTPVSRIEGKTVLLVDDEQPVRTAIGRVLRRNGADVVVAENGEQAIEIFRERKDEIDCVLLDLTMPQMNGEETFRALKDIQPDVRVVLNSGYAELEMLDRFRGRGFAGYLQKPASAAKLLYTLGAAICQASE